MIFQRAEADEKFVGDFAARFVISNHLQNAALGLRQALERVGRVFRFFGAAYAFEKKTRNLPLLVFLRLLKFLDTLKLESSNLRKQILK